MLSPARSLVEQQLMPGRLVVAVAEPASFRLACDLLGRAEREVKHLDGMPRAERVEASPGRVVVSVLDLDVRRRPVRDLLMRVVDRLLVARKRGRAQAHRHALGEGLVPNGTREEVTPAASYDAEPRRHDREHVLQRSTAWPPELVRIGVDHPVSLELGRGQPRHPA